MIISGENSQKAQQVATNKVLSFCYSAYKFDRIFSRYNSSQIQYRLNM